MNDDFHRPILAAFAGVMLIAGAGMAGAFARADQGATASASSAPAKASQIPDDAVPDEPTPTS